MREFFSSKTTRAKSNSIAWIAYRLASLHNDNNESVFDSVIVVTNRVVLDSQLQDTINSFEHVPGLLECIDEKKHSRDLAEAINDKKRIIICTIQKFLFAYKDIERCELLHWFTYRGQTKW